LVASYKGKYPSELKKKILLSGNSYLKTDNITGQLYLTDAENNIISEDVEYIGRASLFSFSLRELYWVIIDKELFMAKDDEYDNTKLKAIPLEDWLSHLRLTFFKELRKKTRKGGISDDNLRKIVKEYYYKSLKEIGATLTSKK